MNSKNDTNQNESESGNRFLEFTRKLVTVPKVEIDEAAQRIKAAPELQAKKGRKPKAA